MKTQVKMQFHDKDGYPLQMQITYLGNTICGRTYYNLPSHPQRKWYDKIQICQALALQYPEATKIRLVQDNLNTHDISAFYENLPANEVLALADRFEFYFTPKSASWLNMIEIEFSALARQCLNLRIPTIDKLEREILALLEERGAKRIKID